MILLAEEGVDRRPRRVQPTSKDVAYVWMRLSERQQDETRRRAVAADQTTFEYIVGRFGVVAGVLFGPRRSGAEHTRIKGQIGVDDSGNVGGRTHTEPTP